MLNVPIYTYNNSSRFNESEYKSGVQKRCSQRKNWPGAELTENSLLIIKETKCFITRYFRGRARKIQDGEKSIRRERGEGGEEGEGALSNAKTSLNASHHRFGKTRSASIIEISLRRDITLLIVATGASHPRIRVKIAGARG